MLPPGRARLPRQGPAATGSVAGNKNDRDRRGCAFRRQCWRGAAARHDHIDLARRRDRQPRRAGDQSRPPPSGIRSPGFVPRHNRLRSALDGAQPYSAQPGQASRLCRKPITGIGFLRICRQGPQRAVAATSFANSRRLMRASPLWSVDSAEQVGLRYAIGSRADMRAGVTGPLIRPSTRSRRSSRTWFRPSGRCPRRTARRASLLRRRARLLRYQPHDKRRAGRNIGDARANPITFSRVDRVLVSSSSAIVLPRPDFLAENTPDDRTAFPLAPAARKTAAPVKTPPPSAVGDRQGCRLGDIRARLLAKAYARRATGAADPACRWPQSSWPYSRQR